MTATDELCAMLDERGVEYETDDAKVSDSDWYRVTYVKEKYGKTWVYEEPPDCCLLISYSHDLGAEQAIAATLGTGVCRNAAPNYLDFLCSECGFVHYHSDENDSGDGNEWNYCPNCGRRIEVTA